MMRQRQGKGTCVSMAIYHTLIGNDDLHPYITSKLLEDRHKCFRFPSSIQPLLDEYAPGLVAAAFPVNEPFDHTIFDRIDALNQKKYLPHTAILLLKPNFPPYKPTHMVAYVYGKFVDSDHPDLTPDPSTYDYNVEYIFLLREAAPPQPQSDSLKRRIDQLFYRFMDNYVSRRPIYEQEGGVIDRRLKKC